MAVRTYKPTSPSRRAMATLVTSDLSKVKPERSLVRPLSKTGGRNNQGVITCRHIGGGVKRKYRVIDFKRDKKDIPGTITTIEYDPNRNARICLVTYKDGEKKYILCPQNVKVGDKIVSSDKADIVNGNCLLLDNIPEGTFVHNVEFTPGKGGQIARAAGTSVQVLGKEGKYTIVRMTSGEMRKILSTCHATIGVLANEEFNLVNRGKGGKTRLLGIRPTVRGSVMNPNDHPHGGGEGKSPVGRDAPRTPWGKRALGVKTRKQKKASGKLMIRRINDK